MCACRGRSSNDRSRRRDREGRTRHQPVRRIAISGQIWCEWPEGEAAPTKYWLSNIAKTISFRDLVDIAKMRWRIERDYQDLKQEIGLGHYEGVG